MLNLSAFASSDRHNRQYDFQTMQNASSPVLFGFQINLLNKKEKYE